MTSLAAMSLSAAGEQGRNASSLNVYDALGLRHLRRRRRHDLCRAASSGNLALTFGLVELSMAVVALLAVFTSLRIGVVRNEFAPLRPSSGWLAQDQDGDEH